MGSSHSSLFDLLGFLETGGGARLVAFGGPTAATRLAITCQDLASARAPWVSWEALKLGCAELAAHAELESIADRRNGVSGDAPFDIEELCVALSGQPHLLPERDLLRALCRICGFFGQSSSAADVALGLDEICIALADGRDPKPLLLWARALRKPGLSALLERVGNTSGEDTQSVQPGCVVVPCNGEDLFDAIFNRSFSRALEFLATGIDLNITGPKMFNGDPGCCHWSPLGAAADVSMRAKNVTYIVALLLAARADADVCCPGPCHWTPLMRAAQANSSQVCKMLVAAQADPRRKHAGDGRTALDMANKETARAIREAREQRHVSESQNPPGELRQEAQIRKPQGRGRGHNLNLAALAFAGRGRQQSKK